MLLLLRLQRLYSFLFLLTKTNRVANANIPASSSPHPQAWLQTRTSRGVFVLVDNKSYFSCMKIKLLGVFFIVFVAIAFSSCKKEQQSILHNNKALLVRIKTIREPMLTNPVSYIISTFQYDNLGRCIEQDVDSGNTRQVWTWSSSAARIDWYSNGSTVPDTFYTINLDNNGLMIDGNLWGFTEAATFNATHQRTFRYFNWNDGYNNYDSAYYFWSNGNIDSTIDKTNVANFGQTTRHSYYPGTINTISAVYYGRTYYGTPSLNLPYKDESFSFITNSWETFYTYNYDFDSLGRAIMKVAEHSVHRDSTFYTYY